MSRKTRILRILTVVLTLVLFVGYFTFSTLLYPPFEGGLGVDVSGLVPRQVDFFVARADLQGAFGDFPHLRVGDKLEDNSAYQTWTSSPEAESAAATYRYGELMESIRTQLGQLPGGIAPMEIFGGKDLALAGNFKGNRIADSDWALYGTLSRMGKLGIALLDFPGTIGLDKQGINVAPGEGFVTLTGANLPGPIHVARILDVGIVSNSVELVQRAIELEARQFKDSFLAGATYHDKIQLADRGADEDEVELYINAREMMATLGVNGAWPDAASQHFLPSITSKYFQLGMVNRLVGILGLDEGLSLDLNTTLSSEMMTSLQTRTYRQRAISGEELVRRYALFAPEDSALFLYFKCDIGDLLTSVFDSMEPAVKNLIEERFQGTGKYQNLAQLIQEIDSSMLDHFVLIVRENDYPPDPEGPPHNNDPMPAFAIITWLADGGREKIDALRKTIGEMGPSIGLQGAEPGSHGAYTNKIGGHEFHEYWSPHINGTGVITAGTTSEVFIVANTIHMLNHVHKTWTQGAPQYPRLSERSDFSALVNSAGNGANLAAWFNPRALMPTLNRVVERLAEDSVHIDWAYERQRVEDKILRESYGGKKKAALSSLELGDFEKAVDLRIDEIDLEVRRTQIPLAREKYDRELQYLFAIRGGLLMLAADPKELDLTLRLMTPYED